MRLIDDGSARSGLNVLRTFCGPNGWSLACDVAAMARGARCAVRDHYATTRVADDGGAQCFQRVLVEETRPSDRVWRKPPRPPLSPAPALRPLLADFVLSMPRGAQVIYPTEGQARDSTVDWVHLKLNDDDCLAVTRSWGPGLTRPRR